VFTHAVVKTHRVVEDEQGHFKSLLREGSAFVMGMPGCGKSHLLVNMAKELEGPVLITAYTNAAVENLKVRDVPRGAEVSTFSSVTFNRATKRCDYTHLQKYAHVILDEYTLMPPNEMYCLYRAWKAYVFRVWAFGDPRQLPAVSDDWVAYHKNPMFLQMTGNVAVTMSYKPGFSRYDVPLYNALVQFQTSKRVPDHWKPDAVTPLTYKNLTFTIDLRNEINQSCLARWVVARGVVLTSTGRLKVCVGLPVVVDNEKDKEKGMFKTQEWIVVAVDSKKREVTLSRSGERETLDWFQFNSMFEYAFAMTVHKCQGITIYEPYTIWEAGHFHGSFNWLNTAMSRGVALSNVYIKGLVPGKVYNECSRKMSIAVAGKDLAIVMKVGRIYRLTCRGLPYIGRTNQTLAERRAEHIASPTNSRMKELIDDSAAIELLYEFRYCAVAAFADVELEYIEKEKREVGDILNFQHNRDVVVADKKATGIRVPKFKIADDVGSKRFEVLCRAKAVDKSDQVARFSYAKHDKSVASEEALEWQRTMLAKYF